LRCILSANRNKSYADVYTEEDPGDGGWRETQFSAEQWRRTFLLLLLLLLWCVYVAH
jgi:hypothetical protein